jgi:hypothetical protein
MTSGTKRRPARPPVRRPNTLVAVAILGPLLVAAIVLAMVALAHVGRL